MDTAGVLKGWSQPFADNGPWIGLHTHENLSSFLLRLVRVQSDQVELAVLTIFWP